MRWFNRVFGQQPAASPRVEGGGPTPPASSDAGSSPPSAAGAGELLDAKTLGRIGGLDMISQTVVDGVMSGKHRSTHRGGCCEFSEHRPYTQGDETRLIDWKLFARRDRHFVKLFDDETNLQAWIVVDTSGSMAFGHSTVSKFDYARVASACLGRLLMRQRDSIGLITESNGRSVHLPPRSQPSHFQGICEALRSATPTGSHPVTDSLGKLPSLAKRRGMVLLFSDCFGDVEELVKSLTLLRLRGHDVMVFQTLAPEELTFSFRGSAVFEDLERVAPRLRLSPGLVRKRYLQRFGDFQERLRSELTRADVDLCTLSTADDLALALSHYLVYRAAKVKAKARS